MYTIKSDFAPKVGVARTFISEQSVEGLFQPLDIIYHASFWVEGSEGHRGELLSGSGCCGNTTVNK